MTKTSISLNDWLYKEIKASGKNVSARVEELLFKGLMLEQKEQIIEEMEIKRREENAAEGI